MGAEPGPDLARLLARVSRELMEGPEGEATASRAARRALDVVPAAEHCSITLRRRGDRVETVASTSDLAETCDGFQYALREGPCLEATWDDEVYVSDDLRRDERWPRWCARVAESGVGSVLAVRLATETRTIGALNLYAEPTHAFDDQDRDVALLFAVHAANAISSADAVEGLTTAMASRHLIGVAQGILMHRYDLGLEQAFEVLRRYSSHQNLKLRDLARTVVERGDLPSTDATDPA
ncbi:GAF and ANTAR domain-containing protein [Nocardioides aurantiacus]|uniref:GAF domain-containing protein n=1 Tax=Nocardioides aurantiacus TaxID=86796 RepID=A0A3N2D0N8_9ACTN|nr:GAF and ANTAR domain-containing protein [Nocardioides aurantiacus]ROR93024.1 GAF domain-containing protein [Nocardioides aurantiacus]